MPVNTWTVSPTSFAASRERVATINARAIKRGFTGRLEVTGTEREVTQTGPGGISQTYTVFDMHIDGEAPSYGGWGFLAAVDTVETEQGHDFVLRCAPGVNEATLDRSILRPGQCQHCRTNRANRVHTYLLHNAETGRSVQVGSTCLRDFLGWEGRPVYVSANDAAEQLDGFLGGLSGSERAYSPRTVVATAWGISRKYGWTSAAAASYGNTCTRELVESYLYGTASADRELRVDVLTEVAAADARADEILTTVLEGLDTDTAYGANLQICLRGTYVQDKHMGLVVSTVAAYERILGTQLRREQQDAARIQSQYAGTVKEKITITGTVTRLTPVQSNYGYRSTTSMLVILEDGPTIAKMFTSAGWAFDIEQGQQLTVTATVKEHEEYQGVRQTVLVRPRLAQSSPAKTPTQQ